MKRNVLIIGGGPAGLCLSLALAAQGLEVELVERQEAEALAQPAYDGREVALAQRAIRLLRTLGIWQYIPDEEISTVMKARIIDGTDTGFVIDAAEYGRGRLGVLVSNHLIRAAAWQAASSHPGIRLRTGTAVESVSIHADGVRVHHSGGRSLEGALLVAADGRFSQTRRSVGIPTRMLDFGMTMLLCRMEHESSNDGVAWEWFGHGQTRALLPVKPQVSSVVLSIPDVAAQALLALEAEEFAIAMTQRFDNCLGEMGLVSERFHYPLVATWPRRLVSPRFALMGDAAVGMHPVTAHGFNLALAGVEQLASAAGDGLRRHGDPAHPAMLARYERQHRLLGAPLFVGTQAVAGIFTRDRPLWQPLRHGIMHAARTVPPLRHALAMHVLDDSQRPGSIAHHLHMAIDVLRPRRSGWVPRT